MGDTEGESGARTGKIPRFDDVTKSQCSCNDFMEVFMKKEIPHRHWTYVLIRVLASSSFTLL